jgi:hypothetical protein
MASISSSSNNNNVQRPLLKSTDRYRFAVAKAIQSHDLYWLAQRFGELFYVEWKNCKDTFKNSGGKEMRSLEFVVKSAIANCNKENGSYYPLRFVELRGAYDIFCEQFPLGTVVRSEQLTDELLRQCVVLKANNKVSEYVRDSEGTIVNRYVYRAVGDKTGPALEYRTTGMKASGVDTMTQKTGYYQFSEIKSQKGSKAVTRSMSEHVMGWKPSMYLSFTTLAKGASNPKGDAFGKVIVKIDLLALKAAGIRFTYLGTKEGALLLGKELKSKTGGITQAFDDITRTREVLVEGWVPPEALCSITDEGQTVWART